MSASAAPSLPWRTSTTTLSSTSWSCSARVHANQADGALGRWLRRTAGPTSSRWLPRETRRRSRSRFFAALPTRRSGWLMSPSTACGLAFAGSTRRFEEIRLPTELEQGSGITAADVNGDGMRRSGGRGLRYRARAACGARRLTRWRWFFVSVLSVFLPALALAQSRDVERAKEYFRAGGCRVCRRRLPRRDPGPRKRVRDHSASGDRVFARPGRTAAVLRLA